MKGSDTINCRVLKNGKCLITQNYSNTHQAVDIIPENYSADQVIAHSDGEIIFYQDGYGNNLQSTGNASYGNCIKLKHQNNFYTLYAHMEKGLSVKSGQTIKKGQILGKISNSGNAKGKHLHFEVWKNNTRINPRNYLDKDLENNNDNTNNNNEITNKLKYSIGETVNINSVYISSTSTEKLTPAITKGKITRIVQNARNPYLLEEGKIGWVNDSSIISKSTNKYLSNSSYKGFSIVDALNQINVDSSYNNRSKLAKLNGIKNYKGTGIQNTNLLNLLKSGKLKYE